MKRTFLISKTILAAAFAATMLPSSATSQESCTVYSVKSGDTLGSIAETAYGTFDYQQIFNANRNAIANPNEIEIGTVLRLPCPDGSLPDSSSAQEIIAAQEAAQQALPKTSSKFEPPIKIVTANGWAPFVGESFKDGGMLVRLATTALNRGGNSREFNVSFVDDWGSHLSTLLPLGAFDVSIAWYLPDCTKIDLLSEAMRKRCTELDGSLPIYETVVGFFSMEGNSYQEVRSYADYAGARICRPEGWFTFDLEEQGLIEPVVTMVVPKTVNECFEMMEAGEVDVVPLEIESVAGALKELDMTSKVAQNPYLTNLLQLSFVTHKTNPRGRVYLALLNRGLTEMRESGEWYAIISDSLAEFNALTN
ncbi:MAG: transporter substrate-binding domain-containing protein [Boseongicola sp.]|nr:transporter substrate-binding domain-containing protein [Boseongicola sp.]